jgi:hypothetical protein
VPQPETVNVLATAVPQQAFGASERQAMEQQVEKITTTVIKACQEAMHVAKDLEQLVIENAARVRTELDDHVSLAGCVMNEAKKLTDNIKKLRDAQAKVADQRNGNGKDH